MLSDRLMGLPTRLRVSMGRAARSAGAQRNKTFGVPFAAVISSGFLFGAFAAESTVAAILLVTGAFFGAWLMVILVLELRWSQPKTVSVMANAEDVVCAPPWVAILAMSLVWGLVLLSLARLWSVPEQWTRLDFYPRSIIVVGPLLGLYMIAEALWRLRRPAGLTLSERGLAGVRAGPQFVLPWATIGTVSVAEGKRRRLLVLTAADGPGMVAIPGGLVGGDAYAVATVVNYYLQHPEERGRLSDGLDAVRRVDAEVSAGRFDAT